MRARMGGKISRRQLLKALAVTAGGAGLGKVLGSSLSPGAGQELLDEYAYLPFISKAVTEAPTATATPTATPTSTPTATPTPTSTPAVARVVHVQGDEATFWDFGDDYYGDFVDQDAVNAMVDWGVTALTGAASLAQAWQALVPNYVPGKVIAVKVNFNGCSSCETLALGIDALVHPINAIVRGLSQAYPDFSPADLWVYDATRANVRRQVPGRFTRGCLYPDVRFFDGDCNETAGYDSADPTAAITWHNPPDIAMPLPAQISDVLVGAAYLINVPIMKRHSHAGVTLSFKNHFGSIANCADLHAWVFPGHAQFGGTRYNPMVDIYRNAHILGKTVLTVGDALFGNRERQTGKPSPWVTFDNGAPNSLFFSADPVAMDCVMCDLLDAEEAIWDAADDYLVYAASLGLGTYERGDPWGGGYTQIDYLKIEL